MNTIENQNNEQNTEQNDKMARITAKEFAELIGADYLCANAMLKYMVKIGVVKEAGKRTPETKGKPSILYDVPEEATLVFWEKNTENTETVPVEPISTAPETV